MNRKRVRLEDLVLPRLLLIIEELERLPTSEAETGTALHPLIRGMFSEKAGAAITFAVMARTSVLFVVDHDEFEQAVTSAGPAPLLPQLPPLPYPRVAMECSEDATWALQDEHGNHILDLEFMMINEEAQGGPWNVVQLMRVANTDPEDGEQKLRLFRILADGTTTELGISFETMMKKPLRMSTEEELQQWANALRAHDMQWEERTFDADDPASVATRTLPIEFAHLVNAHGVVLEPILPPRGERRRLARRKLVHPQVYFVEIRGGEEERQGHSDREYHVRWMVRGHWRHYRNGDRTWIRPYIKGPPGAPWKGRPIYVVR